MKNKADITPVLELEGQVNKAQILLEKMLNAHGGLDRWRKFQGVSAHFLVGGSLWENKGHGGVIDEVDVIVSLLEQKTSHIPNNEWHTAYAPDRIAIEMANGDVVEERYNPRASFDEHSWDSKWNNLQLAYFTGYATWNYFNTPFQFTRPGFRFREIENWEENNQNWRRLIVTWPKDIHTHSHEQTLYIDDDGLIRRLDYRVEVSGNVLCAHYLSGYQEISGIKVATKRKVYLVGDDNKPQLDKPVVVSIDFKDVQFN